MKQYCEMATVPTEWLYALPAHWGCKKIGFLFSERKTKVSAINRLISTKRKQIEVLLEQEKKLLATLCFVD